MKRLTTIAIVVLIASGVSAQNTKTFTTIKELPITPEKLWKAIKDELILR